MNLQTKVINTSVILDIIQQNKYFDKTSYTEMLKMMLERYRK